MSSALGAVREMEVVKEDAATAIKHAINANTKVINLHEGEADGRQPNTNLAISPAQSLPREPFNPQILSKTSVG